MGFIVKHKKSLTPDRKVNRKIKDNVRCKYIYFIANGKEKGRNLNSTNDMYFLRRNFKTAIGSFASYLHMEETTTVISFKRERTLIESLNNYLRSFSFTSYS